MPNYAPLKIAPYWQMTNENLIELIDLVPEDKLDWTPAPGEWSTRLIATHMILARYHAPIVQGLDGAQMSEVIMDCRTKEGLKKHLASSWQMVAEFLSDESKLDAAHEPLVANALSTTSRKSTTATTSHITGWRMTCTTARRSLAT